jgi:hypothetical protein
LISGFIVEFISADTRWHATFGVDKWKLAIWCGSIAISHDRYFLKRIAARVLLVRGCS